MPTSATAAVLHDPHGQFTLQEVELDDPRSDEILVRIEASGVCHTDEMAKGMLEPPMVLGHEGTGVVGAVGSGVTRVKPGDRVVISYAWCGTCRECTTAHGYRCERVLPIAFGGSRLDGSKTIPARYQASVKDVGATGSRSLIPVGLFRPSPLSRPGHSRWAWVRPTVVIPCWARHA